jgi:hypothetical protein
MRAATGTASGHRAQPGESTQPLDRMDGVSSVARAQRRGSARWRVISDGVQVIDQGDLQRNLLPLPGIGCTPDRVSIRWQRTA